MTPFDHPIAETKRPAPNRWRAVLLVGLALLLYLVFVHSSPDLEGWGEDFGAAMRQAAAKDRKILVAFYMPGCAPCAIMDRSVLPAPRVKETLRDFELVRLDATVRTDIAAHYEVYGTPTYAVVDAKGRLLSKREGTLTVDEFVDFLKRAASLPVRSQSARSPVAEAEN